MALVAYAALAIGLSVGLLAVYRIYLHPLASVPGPRLAAVTSWYEFYYDCVYQKGGKMSFKVDELHAKYGPCVRINPWEVHVNDPAYWEALHASSKLNKDHFFYRPFGPHGSIAATASAEQHRIRRGAISNYFSMANVRKHESFTMSLIQRLCQRLEEHRDAGKPANLSDAYRCLATDVVTSFSIPIPGQFVDSPDFAHNFNLSIRDFSATLAVDRHLKFVFAIIKSLPDWVLIAMDSTGGSKTVVQYLALYKKNANIAIERKGKPPGEARASIMDTIVASQSLSDKDKSMLRVLEEGQNISGAGTETTGSTLTTLTYYLLANPSLIQRLKAELREASKQTNAWLDLKTLEKLPYLQACINEALRIGSPVSGRLPRINERSPMTYEDKKNGKVYLFPPGTSISMSMRDIHFNSDIFPEPKTFKPERWLDSTPEQKALMQKFFVPFSKGSRNCIGMDVAKMNLILAAGNVLNQLDMELYETTERDVKMAHDYFAPFPELDAEGVRVMVR